MTDVKSMLAQIQEELENDDDPVREAVREVIRIERRHFYGDENRSARLAELRKVVSKFCAMEAEQREDS